MLASTIFLQPTDEEEIANTISCLKSIRLKTMLIRLF